MKNVLGLLIAVSLAFVAAVLNLKYLERKSQDVETVAFLAVGDGVRIRQGDTFQESQFVPVEIPRLHAGNLQQSAVLYADRHTVTGMKSVRGYEGSEIILRQDLKTPPAEMSLQENERVMWIPVDVNTFVPSLVVPGDFVSFIVAKQRALPDPESDEAISGTSVSGASEIVGPFRIVSLGGRLGSSDVFRASGERNAQENVMGIAVKMQGDELEPKAQKLFSRLQQSGFRQAGVLLHPRKP